MIGYIWRGSSWRSKDPSTKFLRLFSCEADRLINRRFELVRKPYCGELLVSDWNATCATAPPHTIFAGRCIEAMIDDEDNRIEMVLRSTCFFGGLYTDRPRHKQS